jgi:Protein of unknown function (DUF2971)
MFDFVPPEPIAEDEMLAIRTKIWDIIEIHRLSQPQPALLHHYTDAAGLKGILESGVLRATHIAFMNDKSEYLHASELLAEAIKVAKSKNRSLDPLQIKLLEEMEPAVGSTRPENIGLPFFVCCFSAKENNLNQWRAYGRGEGGYSIGFRTAELGSSLGINTILTPVLYKRDVQARLVQDVLAWALEEYLKVSHKYDGVDQEKHRKLWSHHFLFFAAGAAPVMKNPDFCEERE